MAGGNISPRQKMINMMYLVLTALLAMNVSKEIINAFLSVNNSIEKSNMVMTSKNNETYQRFEDAIKDPNTAEKAKFWKEKSDKIKQISSEMSTFLDNQKMSLKKESGLKKGADGKEEYLIDDLDAATRHFIGSDGKCKNGTEVYDKMLKYKKDMIAILNPNDFNDNPSMKATIQQAIKSFENSLPIDMTVKQSKESGHEFKQNGEGWANSNFHMTPTIAAMTIVSKLQSDVKSSEAQMIDYLYSQIGQVKVVYDEFQAIASASTNYCMPGDPIEVYAGVGAFSAAAKPSISINGSNVPLDASGMAIYKTTGNGAGSHSIPVTISFVKPDGTQAKVEKKIEYTVGTPSGAAVMLDKMNVVYIGVDNPVTISSGSGDEKTSASGKGINLRKTGAGKYVATASAPSNDAAITVSVAGGKAMSFPFRVKKIPPPQASLGGTIVGPKSSKAALAAQVGLVAKLDNFPFDARFDIVSFEFIYTPKGQDVVRVKAGGPGLTDAMKGAINRAKPGELVIFDDIKVRGPDGSTVKIGSLNITII